MKHCLAFSYAAVKIDPPTTSKTEVVLSVPLILKKYLQQVYYDKIKEMLLCWHFDSLRILILIHVFLNVVFKRTEIQNCFLFPTVVLI